MNVLIKFLIKNPTGIVNIISTYNVGEEFSSHDFIEKFAQQYEKEYIEMLVNYKNSGSAFQTVHSMIAKYLSTYMTTLGITKTLKKESENVFGCKDQIQWWRKI